MWLGNAWIYASRVLAPMNLSPVYPAMAPGQAIAGLAMAFGLLVLVGSWRRLPVAGKFAVVGFIGCLLPVANITPLYYRFADRYALLALGALAWPIASSLHGRALRTAVVILVPLLLGDRAVGNDASGTSLE